MRFILGDPSLVQYSGHCFSYLAALASELEARGASVVLLGNRAMHADIKARSGALPAFNYWCDARPVPKGTPKRSADALQHVRLAHERAIAEDLDEADRHLSFGRDDVLVLNTLRHWPLRGLVGWLEGLGDRAPKVALILHFTAYPAPERDDGTVRFYKEAFERIEASPLRNRFVLLADAEELIDEYKEITSLEVGLAPIPHTTQPVPGRPRLHDDPLVVAYVGEARVHKGFHLLPHLIEGFRRKGMDDAVRFRIQSFVSNPKEGFYRRAMGRMTGPNVAFYPEQMDDEAYHRYLVEADIILVPYLTDNYHRQTSGIFAEAVALSKPTVVSRGTWMARQVKKYGGGRLFPPDDPEGLLQATLEAVRGYDVLRGEAEAAGAAWRGFHNPETFVGLLTARLEEGRA